MSQNHFKTHAQYFGFSLKLLSDKDCGLFRESSGGCFIRDVVGFRLRDVTGMITVLQLRSTPYMHSNTVLQIWSNGFCQCLLFISDHGSEVLLSAVSFNPIAS